MTFALQFLCLALNVLVCDGVGIRQRLAAAEQGVTEVSESGATASSSSDLASPVPKGGIKRRLQSVSTDQADVDEPLLKSLRRHWAKGTLNSAQVQEFAWGAMHQGATGINIQKLSRVGVAGNHPGNMVRALKGVLGTPKGRLSFVGRGFL